MNSTTLRYKDLLQRRLDVLESIHKNTIDQSGALESRDDALLGKLLQECADYIKSYTQLMRLSKKIAVEEKDDETVLKEHIVNSLLREILSVNGANARKVEELKNDVADHIRRLKRNRNFIESSGLKMSRQLGSLIDRKI